MYFCTRYLCSTLLFTVSLLISVNHNEKNFSGIGCNALLQKQQNGRFFINLGADLAEIFSHYPQSNLARVFNPVLKRAHNQISTSQVIGKLRGGRSFLSNDRSSVQFWVYNDKRNPESYFTIDPSHRSFRSFKVNRNSQVKILIHGFNADNSKRFPQGAKNAYLTMTDHTVIAVDWNELAKPTTNTFVIAQFPAVADNAFRAGDRVADLIVFLLQNRVVSSLEQIHVIGHSVGAHVAGYGGMLVEQRLRAKVGRITGLDPAWPLFRSVPENLKLDRSDANFVDVIHTSIAGLYSPVGHVDFYPNGGIVQPHCLSLKDITTAQECNHLSAYDYYTKTIWRRNISACNCNTWQDYRLFCRSSCPNRSIMGEYASSRARGKYFLDLVL